mgnify:CR=1 FL=1
MHTKNLSDIAHLYGQLLALYQTLNFTTKKINELEKKLINLGESPLGESPNAKQK